MLRGALLCCEVLCNTQDKSRPPLPLESSRVNDPRRQNYPVTISAVPARPTAHPNPLTARSPARPAKAEPTKYMLMRKARPAIGCRLFRLEDLKAFVDEQTPKSAKGQALQNELSATYRRSAKGKRNTALHNAARKRIVAHEN